MKHISLQTAQALREAGWKQEGCAFRYCVPGKWVPGEPKIEHESTPLHYYNDMWEQIAAPTEGELLDALPRDFQWKEKHADSGELEWTHSTPLKMVRAERYCAWYRSEHMAKGDTLAEALALLWIDVCGRKEGTE